MKYTCVNCGSRSYDASQLCNPTSEELDANFCATATDQVCEERRPDMQYSCEACGGMAPDAEHLCKPVKVR
ncbi:hypothetical protein JWJ90_08150 [Desulfobulbus rhabdoformis]|jgi:hypothetical protein|uniref:hypothetical protein n=1 Tax=Desulfobulbus rhabdoformis TaxID=34032 RepID=UPI0019667D03|nr:hypothetical protein [Desulfobulbus rhabdoformis]MBM9614260.1 hypothetical protein [Desulfobulbus rhabdoformis]